MVVAAERNDAKTLSKLVNMIAGRGGYSAVQPTKSKEGGTFGDVEELVEAWREFAESKFKATDKELLRGEMPAIGEREVEDLSNEDLLVCLNALKNCQATNKDGIAAEVFK